MLSDFNIILIFMIQAFSIQRSIAGMYYEINKKITIKLLVHVLTSGLFLTILFNVNYLENYLTLFLILYFTLGNSFILLSREYRFLLHFNFLQVSIYLVIQNINLLDLNIIFIPIVITVLLFWSKNIFNKFEKLRSLS